MKIRMVHLLLLGMVVLLSINLPAASASEPVHKVLVVHSSKSKVIDENLRILDLLIGHFTSDTSFVHVDELEKGDLKGVTHLFYYGQIRDTLPKSSQGLLSTFNGVSIALGHNAEQLGERYSFVQIGEEALYSKIRLVESKETLAMLPKSLIRTTINSDSDVLAMGTHGPKVEYPLVVQHGKAFYYASTNIAAPLSIVLAEIFHDVFQEEHQSINPAYIRLEDIHPKVDPKKLMQIAEVLKERNIPYMIAVVPVYSNPETNQNYLLSDSPKLLEVLKYMQDNGGSIVMHGYTHQFRESETGEGFEFWDVENNMPIYHGPDEKVVVKTKQDFDSEKDYEQYLKRQIEFETAYIDKKLTRGIQELANYGLYPLAFEAPHYTMSQNGYGVVSEYFSTYSGQIQISDEDWEVMTTAPYITRPTFFKGMELLPETVGFVEPNNPKAIEKMLKEAKDYSIVRDGVVAGFYHPYLGVEGFVELLDEMEKIPGIEWIDLKSRVNEVQAKYVEIRSEDGVIVTDISYPKLYLASPDFLMYRIGNVAKGALFATAGVGFFAVILFCTNIIRARQRTNRLRYERRDHVG